MTKYILTLCVFLLFGCVEQNNPGGSDMFVLDEGSVSPTAWQHVVDSQVILFGHQSVGENILSGMKDLNLDTSNFNEVYIGENRNPVSKIEDFESKVNETHTIAMMKLCFVDFNHETDIHFVFNQYVAMVDRLHKKFPNLKLVHTTVPLTSENASIKTKVKNVVKRIMGKPTYDPTLNEIREQYNRLLRIKYGSDFFDIALIESDFGEYSEYNSRALLPKYTYDGGHLNEMGRVVMALSLANTLIYVSK